MLDPGVAGAVQGALWIGHFLHPFIADPGQPQLDRLGLGAGNRLDQAEQGFGIGDIGEAQFSISGPPYSVGFSAPSNICGRLDSRAAGSAPE
jgi:hypothetical protein